eukprot:894359-Prorocentrum_minimum.AAC.3
MNGCWIKPIALRSIAAEVSAFTVASNSFSGRACSDTYLWSPLYILRLALVTLSSGGGDEDET